MKVYNKSNYNVLLKGFLLEPKKVSMEFPDEWAKEADFVNAFDKGWIEIYDPKKHSKQTNQKPASEIKVSYKVDPINKGKIIKKDSVEYILSAEHDIVISKGSDISIERPAVDQDTVIKKNLDQITEEDSLDVEDPLKTALASDDILTETDSQGTIPIDAQEAIDNDLGEVVLKNGKNGAKVINIKKEVQESINQAVNKIAESAVVISEEYKNFLTKKANEKRLFISKTDNIELLKEIANLDKSKTYRNLASQRLKELEK